LTVSIQTGDGGTPDEPDMVDLCSGTLDADAISAVSPGGWYEISMGAGALLSAAQIYFIVVRATDGDASNTVQWRCDESSPTYADGYRCYSSNSGVGWTDDDTIDMMFEEYGT